jgi:hypothetical protein
MICGHRPGRAGGVTTLRVDLASPVPVYEQIRSQVSALVAVGGLRPGDRLPASRDLARDLGVAAGHSWPEPASTGWATKRSWPSSEGRCCRKIDPAAVSPGRPGPDR